MSAKNRLGETVGLRIVTPVLLYKRIVDAAAKDKRTVSEFVRLLLDKTLPN